MPAYLRFFANESDIYDIYTFYIIFAGANEYEFAELVCEAKGWQCGTGYLLIKNNRQEEMI